MKVRIQKKKKKMKFGKKKLKTKKIIEIEGRVDLISKKKKLFEIIKIILRDKNREIIFIGRKRRKENKNERGKEEKA